MALRGAPWVDYYQEVAFPVLWVSPKIVLPIGTKAGKSLIAGLDMAHINESTGRLVPTGKNYPEIVVRAAISHELLENTIGSEKSQQKKVVVHSVIPQNGDVLPAGDFDLVIGGKLLRLKKVPNSAEWLVLSSPTA